MKIIFGMIFIMLFVAFGYGASYAAYICYNEWYGFFTFMLCFLFSLLNGGLGAYFIIIGLSE